VRVDINFRLILEEGKEGLWRGEEDAETPVIVIW
jgi:hypothetical protein